MVSIMPLVIPINHVMFLSIHEHNMKNPINLIKKHAAGIFYCRNVIFFSSGPRLAGALSLHLRAAQHHLLAGLLRHPGLH